MCNIETFTDNIDLSCYAPPPLHRLPLLLPPPSPAQTPSLPLRSVPLQQRSEQHRRRAAEERRDGIWRTVTDLIAPATTATERESTAERKREREGKAEEKKKTHLCRLPMASRIRIAPHYASVSCHSAPLTHRLGAVAAAHR